MYIHSLFSLANILQEKHLEKGEYLTHFELLDEAATEILKGYLSLKDAGEENLERINPFGFTIKPDAISDAIRYVEETPDRWELRPLLKHLI